MKELSKVLSWKDLLSYNPLSSSRVSDKVKEYEEAYQNNSSFSGWIDNKELQIDGMPTDVKYGIPVNIIGNPCSSSVFCCLVNPSVKPTYSNNINYNFKDYVDNIEDDDAFDKKSGNLNEELFSVKIENPVKYLDYYKRYYKLIGDILGDGEKLKNTNKICNIDLIPFRSKDPSVFKKRINNPYSKFSVLVMLWKISQKDSTLQKPIFFLRSAQNYCKVIDQVLNELQENNIGIKGVSDFKDLIVREETLDDGYILGLGGGNADSTRKPYLLTENGKRYKKVEDVNDGLSLLRNRVSQLL